MDFLRTQMEISETVFMAPCGTAGQPRSKVLNAYSACQSLSAWLEQ
jgi:hypothetical protein